MNLTRAKLMRLLKYSPRTGKFTWLVARGPIPAGREAGCTTHVHGYVLIGIGGKLYKAHRLAWLYMTGRWPLGKLDHKNRNRADNRWTNLREATDKQNAENTSLRSDNTSGHKGVSHCRDGKWQARIFHCGKEIYLGRFFSKIEAIRVRKTAEKQVFTHA